MRIVCYLNDGNDKITNFKIAEAVVDLCDDTHYLELNAEVVAKMILLQIETKKGGKEE